MLTFAFGAMGSGKSAYAVMTAQQRHRPRAQGHPQTAVLATTWDRDERGVASRTGLWAPALRLIPGAVHGDQFGDADTIVVDEAQFLTPADVEVLVALSNAGRGIVCFGLRTDFRGRLFPGSQRLLERADVVRQVPLEPQCTACDRTAVINARFVGGQLAATGAVVALGDVAQQDAHEGTTYEPLCVRCWYSAGQHPSGGVEPFG